jgi:hypothetical protein
MPIGKNSSSQNEVMLAKGWRGIEESCTFGCAGWRIIKRAAVLPKNEIQHKSATQRLLHSSNFAGLQKKITLE